MSEHATGGGSMMGSRARRLVPALLLLACRAEDGGGTGDGMASQTSADVAGDPATGVEPSTGGAESPGTSMPTASATATGEPTTGDADTITSGGATEGETDTGTDAIADYCGRLLFAETFEDTAFDARGWYDGPAASLSTDEHIEGSTSSFACRFTPGATGCEGGRPGRHLFEGQTAVCLSYWVKHTPNWVGSGLAYHPHMFHFVTNADDIYVGPATTYLTLYIEQVAGTPRLAIQDSRNVDPACVLLNNDSFVGCNGDFDTYAFTENRSAASCNGLLGDVDGRDCFSTGAGYYSARFWDAEIQAFGDAPPWDKSDWHQVVAYWRLNDIEDGVGVPNGVLRYWVDEELLIAYDAMFLRTGAHPDMVFDQFLVTPYIGDGSPVDQTMWIDDLEVAAGL